jgi:hypothetical protein
MQLALRNSQLLNFRRHQAFRESQAGNARM